MPVNLAFVVWRDISYPSMIDSVSCSSRGIRWVGGDGELQGG